MKRILRFYWMWIKWRVKCLILFIFIFLSRQLFIIFFIKIFKILGKIFFVENMLHMCKLKFHPFQISVLLIIYWQFLAQSKSLLRITFLHCYKTLFHQLSHTFTYKNVHCVVCQVYPSQIETNLLCFCGIVVILHILIKYAVQVLSSFRNFT